MTRIGTSHFVSRQAAERYYSGYTSNAVAAVSMKLASGEIHIGKPKLAPGERLVLIDNRMRYAIELAR